MGDRCIFDSELAMGGAPALLNELSFRTPWYEGSILGWEPKDPGQWHSRVHVHFYACFSHNLSFAEENGHQLP